MQIDGAEGRLSGELQPHHDHASHPEEQDIMPCLHDGRGVELGQVRGWGVSLGPAKGAEGPQAGGEPGVQHVLLLAQHNTFAIPAQQALLFALSTLQLQGKIPFHCSTCKEGNTFWHFWVLPGTVGKNFADSVLTVGIHPGFQDGGKVHACMHVNTKKSAKKHKILCCSPAASRQSCLVMFLVLLPMLCCAHAVLYPCCAVPMLCHAMPCHVKS